MTLTDNEIVIVDVYIEVGPIFEHPDSVSRVEVTACEIGTSVCTSGTDNMVHGDKAVTLRLGTAAQYVITAQAYDGEDLVDTAILTVTSEGIKIPQSKSMSY